MKVRFERFYNVVRMEIIEQNIVANHGKCLFCKCTNDFIVYSDENPALKKSNIYLRGCLSAYDNLCPILILDSEQVAIEWLIEAEIAIKEWAKKFESKNSNILQNNSHYEMKMIES